MERTQTKGDPTAFVRDVLPLMAKHKVPITPPNYAVWYTYVSGENHDLRQDIDAVISGPGEFTPDLNQRLFRQYGFGFGTSEIQIARKQLRQVLVSMLQEVTGFDGQTGKYESSLARSIELFSQDMTIDQLNLLVNHLLKQTHTIASYGRDSRQRMQVISNDLEAVRELVDFNEDDPSVTDLLTGLANRKSFDDVVRQMTYHADSLKQDLSMLLIDIDHFDQICSRHGKPTGDEMLRYTARQLKKQLRGSDFVARFTGEAFAVLLPGTNVVGAKAVGENIRFSFASTTMKMSETAGLRSITVSIGVAPFRRYESADVFISRAETSLAAAKKAGSDNVFVRSTD